MVDRLDSLNSQLFKAQLHTKFKVHAGNEAAVTLELAEVNEPPSKPNIELFSLLFRGPQTPVLKQRVHSFEHEKLGSHDLFLTPIASDDGGTTYEVIFHRLRGKQP